MLTSFSNEQGLPAGCRVSPTRRRAACPRGGAQLTEAKCRLA